VRSRAAGMNVTGASAGRDAGVAIGEGIVPADAGTRRR
jgi:hypothetical protein